MRRFPHSRDLDRALRTLRAAGQKSLKELDRAAGQKMAKGDYATAEGLAAKGKELRQFLAEVATLHEKWRATGRRKDKTAKSEITPLWRYFHPILRALVKRGGVGNLRDLETDVEHMITPTLLAGDKVLMARGRERWRVMVRSLMPAGKLQAGAVMSSLTQYRSPCSYPRRASSRHWIEPEKPSIARQVIQCLDDLYAKERR